MPVIRIAALPQAEGVNVSSIITAVSTRAAEALGIPPQQVWTIWHSIEPGHYCEGDDVAQSQPRDTHSPIVDIMAYEGRSPELIKKTLDVVAKTLCEHLKIEAGSVFITWTELKAGRVYTGGAVR